MENAPVEQALCKIANEVIALPEASFTSRPSIIENPWKDFATTAKASTTSTTSLGALIEYSQDSSGATGLAKRMIESKGFLPNSTVAIKEGKANAGAQYKIKSIDADGTVKLKPIRDGQECDGLVKSKSGVFIEKYVLSKLGSSIFPYPQDDIQSATFFPLL